MTTSSPVEQLMQRVFVLDHQTCKCEIRKFREPVLDFPDELLDSMSTDRLRHILIAACIQVQKKV